MARDRATDTAALVAAAAEVFREKGYRNSTIDDIAEAAGISRPTVYKYTKSKRWLLDRMVETVTEDLGRRLRSVLSVDYDPASTLERVIRTHVDAAAANRIFYAIVFSEETELSEAGRERFRAWAHDVTTEFQTLLERCLEQAGRPESSTVDTWIAANLILSMLTSLYRWYDPRGQTTPEELSEQIKLVIGKTLF